MFIEKTKTELADIFLSNLLPTNRSTSYYIDWSNTFLDEETIIQLNALNVLIGKNDTDFDRLFRMILLESPNTMKCFPLLFALAKEERKRCTARSKLKIVADSVGTDNYIEISFNPSTYHYPLNETEFALLYNTFVSFGIKELFQHRIQTNAIDYAIGVLVGLDSNGRKNRGGSAFEIACEPIIRNICYNYDIELLTQTFFRNIVYRYPNITIDPSMFNRKADFILIKDNKCMNIEANFFNSTGSKADEIITSYRDRNSTLNSTNISFALITDGLCWRDSLNPLNVGINSYYISNYKMARDGYVKEIICKEFEL